MLNAKIAFCIAKKYIQEAVRIQASKKNDWSKPVITNTNCFSYKGESFVTACYHTTSISPSISFWSKKENGYETAYEIRPAWQYPNGSVFVWSPCKREFVKLENKTGLEIKKMKTIFISDCELPAIGSPCVVWKNRETRRLKTPWKSFIKKQTLTIHPPVLTSETNNDSKGKTNND